MKNIAIECDLCSKKIHEGHYQNTMQKISQDLLKEVLMNCESYIYNGVGHATSDLCSDCLTKFVMQNGGGTAMRSTKEGSDL